MSRTLQNVTVTDKLDTKYLTAGSFRNSNLTNDKLDSLSCFYDNILINSSNVSLTLPNNFINSDTGSTFQVIKTGSNILAIRPPPISGSNIFILNGSTNPIKVTTNYQVKTITFGGISGFNNNFYLS